MSDALSLPPFAAGLVAVLLILGSTLTFLGNYGLLRFRRFYERLHPPTLGTSWGTCAIALAWVVTFSTLSGRLQPAALVVALFMMITAPIGLLLLGQAALNRGAPGEPPPLPEDEDAENTSEH